MADKLVGKVVHFYDKISVAVIMLSEDLQAGDQVKIVKDGNEFLQEITSMQLDHKPVQKAQKGEEAAVKTEQPAPKGAEVYKV